MAISSLNQVSLLGSNKCKNVLMTLKSVCVRYNY